MKTIFLTLFLLFIISVDSGPVAGAACCALECAVTLLSGPGCGVCMCAKTLATEFWHGPAKLSTPQSPPVCSRSWLRLLLQQPRFTVAQHIHNPPRHAAHHLDHRILSSGVTQDFDDLLRCGGLQQFSQPLREFPFQMVRGRSAGTRRSWGWFRKS